MFEKKTCVFCGKEPGPENPFFCSKDWASLKAMRPRKKSIQPIAERVAKAVAGTSDHFTAIGDAIHALHASEGGKKRAAKYSEEQLKEQAARSRQAAIKSGKVEKTIAAATEATKKRHRDTKRIKP